MDRQALLQQLQQIKESTKSIMKEDVNNGEATSDVATDQDQLKQTI